MRDAASNLVRKLWQYCNVLRDDGLSYPDYVEQLTYLLFLKMADEQPDGPVPAEYGWKSLVGLDPPEMQRQYIAILSALDQRSGMLGLIFHNAKNKIRDPAKLRLLVVDLIGQTEWSGLSSDLKGDAYEGLLEKNARDTKSGAGQYFTPRPLIDAIVQCVDPGVGEVICDPACGTAGFLLVAHEYVRDNNKNLTAAQADHLRTRAIRGVELVDEVARLAAMNLLLHGVADHQGDAIPITCADSLKEPPSEKVDVVLSNPPFGVKGSVTYSNAEKKSNKSGEDLTIVRSDFFVQTANKQLNFLQHILSLLSENGRAAVVIPDNVLFESGPAASIRRRILETCDVHTLLRLPAGLFYAAGVKANVLFFQKRQPQRLEGKRDIWVYDLRPDNRFSLKANPMRSEDLSEFVSFYKATDRQKFSNGKTSTRWKSFPIDLILSSGDASLDLSWEGSSKVIADSSLERLEELSEQIAEDLHLALSFIQRAAPRKPH